MKRGPRCVTQWILCFFPTICAASLSAQSSMLPTNPRLQEIVRLAQDGYGDSARAMVSRILARTPATDSAFPEVLYTAGSVAKVADETRTDFARIAVEFPASPWADKASLRLVQLEYGNGNLDAVVNRVTRMFVDFPNSPIMPQAALWGARAAFELQKPQLACDWVNRGIAQVGDDVELRNQLQFAHQRCDLGPGVQFAPVVPESLRAGPPPRGSRDTSSRSAPVTQPPPPPPAHAPPTPTRRDAAPATRAAGPWRVQVAAVSDKAVINHLSAKLRALGFEVYTVPAPRGLTRVQAGPFASRAAAAAEVGRIKAAVGGAPFVTQ